MKNRSETEIMNKIIIADDSSTARMFLQRSLEIAGLRNVTFLEAENGKLAYELLEKEGCDMVITDLNMPEMDGTELLKKIQAEERFQDIPVLVITSVKNPAKMKELIKIGAFAVLAKPVSPPMLAKALQPFIPEKGKSAW